MKKQEALTVGRFINEMLVGQLKIPLHQIVNDKTFTDYTDLKRPDILISSVPYDMVNHNEKEYIENLIVYAEAKDNCIVNSSDWIDAYNQGMEKSKKLNMPYFVVTNLQVSYYYNAFTGEELKLNGNPIRTFQNLDISFMILRRLQKDNSLSNISTDLDTQSAISETVFNSRLWILANIYRQVNFKNITEKMDFTIGFIAAKYYEEKVEQDKKRNNSITYWSDIVSIQKLNIFKQSLISYIDHIKNSTEFKDLMEVVEKKITTFDVEVTKKIFDVIESMGRLHGGGFDLFGAVYEMFASNKEKSDFGEYFTRRHYTNLFSKLLLTEETSYSKDEEFALFDPACGTGGFLTETFKVLKNNYRKSNTLSLSAWDFLRTRCIYGVDVREENVARAKLNMFLVGDGHTNLIHENTLDIKKLDERVEDILERKKWPKMKYIITNPPYGNGITKAETTVINSSRYEVAFLARIFKMLKTNGKACVVVPDGIFENPSLVEFRKEILEKSTIEGIISLPKFAFAPYTKQKTCAIFFKRKADQQTTIQTSPIYMYIIDNDGFANSDKRFPTKLKNEDGSWMHDEISSWVNTKTGEEKLGLVETRWKVYDDKTSDGTEWINERGEKVKKRKAGYIQMSDINSENYFNLLPEFHLRKAEPDYITLDDFVDKLNAFEKNIGSLNTLTK
ncbi:N-6 DNA methylase [Sporosarcina sp. USHLN248]|uniref:HsdM family class I SAM-dependent methyltransferase n=1 Tax=Sporosarcina sp. USHLN248 TaxID=3081300 RepID=UPI003018E0DF